MVGAYSRTFIQRTSISVITTYVSSRVLTKPFFTTLLDENRVSTIYVNFTKRVLRVLVVDRAIMRC
jgi:hypothetical protein